MALEVSMDDIRAVMDASGSERAVLFGSTRRSLMPAVRSIAPGTDDGGLPHVRHPGEAAARSPTIMGYC